MTRSDQGVDDKPLPARELARIWRDLPEAKRFRFLLSLTEDLADQVVILTAQQEDKTVITLEAIEKRTREATAEQLDEIISAIGRGEPDSVELGKAAIVEKERRLAHQRAQDALNAPIEAARYAVRTAWERAGQPGGEAGLQKLYDADAQQRALEEVNRQRQAARAAYRTSF